MKICVVGTGYVGLVTGTCFAENGHTVCCVDIDKERIGKLRNGISPIYEPGLDELIERNQREGRLSFSTKIKDGLEGTQLCFIAVGTPPADDGRADLAQVLAAIDDIGSELSHSCYIVVKSTVPVGTGTLLCKRIKSHLRGRGMEKINLEILSNPEFLKEGMAIEDCLHPDRVVIGAASDEARAVMRELYLPFVSEERIIFMDPASAEITKYAANTMLAARISFMNEIAQLCDKVGADVLSVKKGMASDRRIGEYFLNAGCGYGGSCFPKDVKALCYIGEDMEDIEAAIMGLAFKPQTNDMREAPSIALIRGLLNCGAAVRAYDPIAMDEARKLLPENVGYAGDIESLVDGADCAVIVTEWRQFREADWEKLGKLMKRKIVFDGRNICDPDKMKALGFEYYCIGRNMRPCR